MTSFYLLRTVRTIVFESRALQVDITRLAQARPDLFLALEKTPTDVAKAVGYICSSLRPSAPALQQPLHVYVRPAHALGECCSRTADFHRALSQASAERPATLALTALVVKLSKVQTAAHSDVHACPGCKCVSSSYSGIYVVDLLACTT